MAERSTPISIDWDAIDRADGWSLKPAIAWLTAEGRFAEGLDRLTGGVGETLRAHGAPIVRIRLASFTLHPQVRAWTGTWHFRQGATQSDFVQTVYDSPAYIGSPVQIMTESGKPYRHRFDRPLGPDAHEVLHEIMASGVTDYVVMGMPGRDGPIGFISYSTERATGFEAGDVAKLEALTPFVAQVVDTVNRGRVAATLLDTYIGHRAGQRVLAGHIHRGDSEKIRAAIWYSDLRNFTRLNEQLTPEAMVITLNTYFGAVGDAIMARGGEVLQFIGDAVLAIFECAADEADTRRACIAAFEAARAALAAMAERNMERSEAQLPPIRFGVGLHVGDVTFGNVGAETRLGFNVVGPAVNLTARLETLSKEVGAPLVTSAGFAAAIDRDLRRIGTYALKGVREMQDVFTAADLLETATPT